MTTEELAENLGVARQTVNRWIRQQGWKTEGVNGVKGGRARLIHIDARVKEHIMKRITASLVTVVAALTFSGCANMSPQQRNTAIGAAVGGVAGSVLTGGSSVGTVVVIP